MGLSLIKPRVLYNYSLKTLKIMNLLQVIMPIFIPDSGNSAPMTQNDINVMTGIWIVLNIVWILSWIKVAIQVWVFKKEWDFDDNLLSFIALYFDFCMAFFWIVIFLFYAGTWVAKFL